MPKDPHIVTVHCKVCGYRTVIDTRSPARCPHGPKKCYMPLERED